jgi:protein SCO1/2
MRRHLLPIGLAFFSFGILLPGILFYLAQSWDAGRGTSKHQASPTVQSQVLTSGAKLQPFDEKEILRVSQAAIGNQIGDYTLLDRSGRKFRLSDYRGKPLVISMIFTHCPIICSTITRNLTVLKASQAAFGEDSFGVLTVGFDTENDTPETMCSFAKHNGIDLKNWEFASSDPETIKKLSNDLGFTFFPADEGGFNHITQTTFIDAQGKVYRQIYGDKFDNKTLLEPLRELIYNVKTAEPGFAGLSNKVKLFCTVYNTQTGKYTVDYSYFYGLAFSIFVSFLIVWWIIYEYRRSPKRDRSSHD